MRINLKFSTFIALLVIAIILLPTIALSGSHADTACSASTGTAKDNCTGSTSSYIKNSTITGVKFIDTDINGLMSSGESVVQGIEIRLYNATTDTLLTSDTTDSTGAYAFTGLAAGLYEVREVLPSGYVNTTPSIVQVTLRPNRTVVIDFGNYYKLCPTVTPTCSPTPSPSTAKVAGMAFIDENEDGTLDSNDPRVSGVTVRIASIYGLVIDEDVTDSQGYYEFTGLSPATYRVFIVVPDGFTNTTPTSVEVTLSAGQTRTVNFGLIYEEPVGDALIKGIVFYDTDENGQYDSSDSRISDVTVSLYSSGNSLLGTRVTNSQGYYEFADISPGTYTVRVTVPDGFVSTTPTSVQVTLSAGETAQAPFGLVYGDTPTPPVGNASIRGICYIDENGNNAFDESDQRVEGINILLRNANGDLLAEETTNSQGFFIFEDLAAGTYVVSTELPDEFVSGSNSISVNLAAGEAAGVSFSILLLE